MSLEHEREWRMIQVSLVLAFAAGWALSWAFIWR